ncbi:MAG TPA: calcium-binding protein [Actinomycetota bacterium]|nr:calcium-binding protein [Actinomycetota bacterium]
MVRRLSLVLTVLSIPAFTFVTSAALAATPKCGGKAATKVGTARADEITGTRRADVIVGLGGDDVIAGMGGNDVICGGKGHDFIGGGAGSNRLFGGPANDGFLDGRGNDVIAGQGGVDGVGYYTAQGPLTVDLASGRASGEGSDILLSIENAIGGPFDDTLIGNDGANYLEGNLGHDTINAGAGQDIIMPGARSIAGPDDDTIDGGSEFDLFMFGQAPGPLTVDFSQGTATGEGTDHFTAMEGMLDSPYDDRIVGNDEGNVFIAWGGNDDIEGRGGFDILTYWLANEPVKVDLEEGTASGLGNDSIADVEGAWGAAYAPNELYGDSGNNILWGGYQNDRIYGRGGEDYIGGFVGDDLFDGGAGTFDIGTFCAPCTPAINADLRTGQLTGPGNVSLVGIESIEGSPGDDVIIGTDGSNVIYGLTGDDQLIGLAGDDYLAGDEGDDQADAGDGDDNCYSTESPVSCESVHVSPSYGCVPVLGVRSCMAEGREPIPLHPLQATETSTEALHVSFARSF